MPVFDYLCPKCGYRKDDVYVHRYYNLISCDKCMATMQKLVPNKVTVQCFPSEGIYLEHVGPKGKRFYSKKEMIRYANEHDLELGALL